MWISKKYITILERALADEQSKSKALTDDNRRLVNLVVGIKARVSGPFKIEDPIAELGPGFRRESMQDRIRKFEVEHDTHG